MFLVLGIVILVASFSIVGNLIMVVVEKAREIALLKTLGASDLGVMQLFAIQGLMIGLIGTVLGVTTGLLGVLGAAASTASRSTRTSTTSTGCRSMSIPGRCSPPRRRES